MKSLPVHRYVNGEAYRKARGRQVSNSRVDDARDWNRQMMVIDLHGCQPTVNEFVEIVLRELKIRFYSLATVKQYKLSVLSFLKWAGVYPHEINREHVRRYLEYLVDAGLAANAVAVQLSAIRTVFDKFCFEDVTLGIMTPRVRKRLPVVLSETEIQRLLDAAFSRRDKLLLGLMYATGMRVGEIVSLRIRDLDFDRRVITVRMGKGNTDRLVCLPNCYAPILSRLASELMPGDFLFASETGRVGRHLSPRTVQRVMCRTMQMAGIHKKASPHSLRHSFATHSFENGCDIRRIQRVLGHVRLETTTIYVKVAQGDENRLIPSPMDSGQIGVGQGNCAGVLGNANSKTGNAGIRRVVGSLKIHCRDFAGEKETRVTIEVNNGGRSIFFTGIRANQDRPGFWTLSFPPQEDWEANLEQLPTPQRERFEDFDFYQLLQASIIRSVQRLHSVPNALRKSA